ncbi:MAG: toll/interleukin-1 receptor domain-containing protein [Gammaproteobacteria bacterium]
MIFLSYSRGDARQADDWVANLEQYGYRVWIDREGIRGGLWMRTIVRSIREAQAVIVLLSPNSAQSDNVRREMDLAVQAKKLIIPVEIQTTTIPDVLLFQLAGVQVLKVWSNPRRGLRLVVAALEEAGVERGSARIVEAIPGRRGSGEADVDLADLGNLGFLSKIAFWRRK